ncbi:YdeI/OmpD-associated family protein [Thalassotalea atypica]|uniref:YdeI/OmpD-associated family protein n=1 Tax=Thalassotalea atypica TaxID=2054316 RepID=UPI002573CAF8|nr:YdeI/OmpD-associated family protein [Thalassotalea atypica]
MSQQKAIDRYIKSKPEFARPILKKLRVLVNEASSDIEEAIKWRQPCFSEQGLVCAMAAFKNHVTFSFFNGKSLNDTHQLFEESDNENLAALKFREIGDLPVDAILIDYIRQAIAVNHSTDKTKSQVSKKNKSELIVPDDLQQALATNIGASRHFADFSYSKQKDYIEWITSAKKEATRLKRLSTAIEWISEGKGRNWKYEKC